MRNAHGLGSISNMTAARTPVGALLAAACAVAVCLGASDRVYAKPHGLKLPPGLAKKIPPRGPKPKNAQQRETMIEKGRRLFFEETFDGNGRTCGTCHPATNNFTVDPAYIKRLKRSDPMFVHERMPELAELEDAVELRKNALFCENLDGFEDQQGDPIPCVLRSVPHTLGLPVGMATNDLEGITEALGWSGDGSPGGTLRDFAFGAIVQHFPKTLDREPGLDFRLPTAEELDAMEQFQLSLGRTSDPDLANTEFADNEANAGRDAFFDGGRPPGCHACHANAGAIDGFGNGNNLSADTGTRALRTELPADDGFRSGAQATGTFNTPPLIEAADSGPYFHNNAVRTLEQAIDFYASDRFAESPAGTFGRFVFQPGQVRQIATMLRYLNVAENIRAAKVALRQAGESRGKLRRDLIAQARADIADGIAMLKVIKSSRRVTKQASKHLKRARAFANRRFARSIAEMDAARRTILVED